MSDSEHLHDVIVVGSGLAGTHACHTLVEAGADVLLIDAGISDRDKLSPFPDLDFETIRRTITHQRKLFLGDDFQGIPWGTLKAGAQLTPQRQYVMRGVDNWLRLLSESFFPFESLARGGLGAAWGAGCYMFSEAEFKRMGFHRNDFLEGYRTVADRIGISAANDDAAPYMVSGIPGIHPAIEPEARMRKLEQRYLQQRKKFNAAGFHMGRPALAAITRDMNGRKAFDYSDMEFWHDQKQSVYRSWMTLNALEKHHNLKSVSGKLALSFADEDGIVSLSTIDLKTNDREVFKTKKLILCSGVLGTARIVLRSVYQASKLPILCNAYSYVPMVDVQNLGKSMPQQKSGLGQLVMFHDPDGSNADVAMAALFTYRSLMLFRLVKESPFNFADGRVLMQYLLSGLTIAGIHHPEAGGEGRRLWLDADSHSPTGDALHAQYHVPDAEKAVTSAREQRFFKMFRKLGQYPIRKVDPGMGSSIHYAGTLPVSSAHQPMHTAPDGRLYGAGNVWIGDASSFKFLPAKGISLTIMANAHRVAKNLLSEMRQS